jgi:hypothetical protein
MGISDYVAEAVNELNAPAVWLFRNKFDFDYAGQEWCFTGSCFKGPKSLADAREWVEKICGWLQYQYPDGQPYPVPEAT